MQERTRAPSAICALSAAAFMLLLQSGASYALTTKQILTYKGPDRQKVLVAGAKKEGQLVFYSGMIVNQALRPIIKAFSAKYPFLNVTYWRGNSEATLAKVGTEIRAHHLIADVIEGSGIAEGAVDAHLVQPFHSPQLAQYPKKYRDPQHLWAPDRLSYFGLAYNTNLVPANEVPKTYQALLDPKWKGKMAWPVTAATGASLFVINLRTAWGKKKAFAYLDKLAKQKLINYAAGSARTLVNRVIAGEYPIAIAIYAHHPLISRAKGAPVNSQLLDPVPSAAGTMLIPVGVRHPYAAMLLIDFILSKQGQQVLAKAHYFPVRKDVEVSPFLKPVVPENVGMKENFVNPAELQKYLKSSYDFVQKEFR